MKEFDAKKVTEDCVKWIQEWFAENGQGCNAVVGISGGKDSSVVAALCVQALGKDRVIGVLMPNKIQQDLNYSKNLCNILGIKRVVVDIGRAVDGVLDAIANGSAYSVNISRMMNRQDSGLAVDISEQTKINLPPRIRMATLYAVAQSCNGRVANTCNLSEDWVGYSTRYGDSVGDFSPCSNLTQTEVKEIGRVLGLPSELIDKVPSDGLCGKTDEDNLGFSYAVLDRYIRTGEIESEETKALIDSKNKKNAFKLQLMQAFPYQG